MKLASQNWAMDGFEVLLVTSLTEALSMPGLKV